MQLLSDIKPPLSINAAWNHTSGYKSDQVMACRHLGPKPLPGQMLICFKWDENSLTFERQHDVLFRQMPFDIFPVK